MSPQFVGFMQKGLSDIEVPLSEYQLNQFYQYYQMILEWNKVMNLTAITELEDVIKKHFLDSLSIVKAVADLGQEKRSIIDVGTGAGFPGIPLKIAFPKLEITLLDSLNKRVKFLNQVIEELELSSIQAIHGRAEDIGRDKSHREMYDICVSRAVANLATLSEYALPFVKKDGYFISYKSGKIEEEVVQSKRAIERLGGVLEEMIPFQLSGTDAERSFIVVKKVKGISAKYPRKAGLPAKEPLK